MQKKTLAKTLIVLGAVLIVISAVGLFLILIGRSSHEYFFAASGSMEPAVDKGDCVKVKLGVTFHEIYAAPKPDGDIIAFHKPTYPSDVILHRAVGSGTDTSYYLVTQGDANPAPDGWRVRETDIIGKVVEINPPFWTYNFFFWIPILGGGVTIIVGGVVIMAQKRVEVYRADKAVKTEAAAASTIQESTQCSTQSRTTQSHRPSSLEERKASSTTEPKMKPRSFSKIALQTQAKALRHPQNSE